MSEPGPERASGAPRPTLRPMVLAAFVLAAVAIWIWSQGAERRGFRGLPADERKAVYLRTLENLQTVCASPDLALEEYCREQARVLLAFPECDASCREIARLQIGRRGG